MGHASQCGVSGNRLDFRTYVRADCMEEERPRVTLKIMTHAALIGRGSEWSVRRSRSVLAAEWSDIGAHPYMG